MPRFLDSIEEIVREHKAVISADDSVIVNIIQQTVRSEKPATFYVTHAQSDVIMRWFFTNERIERMGMEPVSKEEKQRIEEKLGVKETGSLYSNTLKCGCGAEYGAFEFIQQGIREHGAELVSNVLELKETSVIRVNPPIRLVCKDCNQRLLGGHYYCWVNGYLCCSSEVLTY